MKHIVITGSTRGIGFGLAESFLDQGCAVTVSGRSQAGVDQAVSRLAGKYPSGNILGCVCDVRQAQAVQALWEAAARRFGEIDIWVNNAGYSGPQSPLWQIPAEQAAAIVETNLLGVIYGCQVAVTEMLKQGYGAIYNMEGAGSSGNQHGGGLSLYGTTKYGLHYLTQALVEETRETPLVVGALRPGMVITDMILDQFKDDPAKLERVKRIFNILADRVETVAPWMAEQILANRTSGRQISWLTRPKIIGRFLSSPFRKRDVFSQN